MITPGEYDEQELKTKVCCKCGLEKPISDFSLRWHGYYGKLIRRTRCRICTKEDNKVHNKGLQKRLRNIKQQYGLSHEVAEILAGMTTCTCCNLEQEKTLNVEHCHKTGQIRGMTCTSCNFKLATLDDEEWVEKGLYYKNNPILVEGFPLYAQSAWLLRIGRLPSDYTKPV